MFQMMPLGVQMISILVHMTILYVCATIKYQTYFWYQHVQIAVNIWAVLIIHICLVQQKRSVMILLMMTEVI